MKHLEATFVEGLHERTDRRLLFLVFLVVLGTAALAWQ